MTSWLRRPGSLLMIGALVAGTLLRWPLVRDGVLNSDEAFTGLVAREASRGRLLWT